MPNSLTVRGATGDMLKSVYDQNKDDKVDVVQSQISDLDHDAQKIKGVIIDDTDKDDQKVLAYDLATQTLVYITQSGGVVIGSIQHVTLTIPDGDLSNQALINSVDTDNTFLIYSGSQCATNDADHGIARIELTDSTHITATRGDSSQDLILHISVIECTAGIKSIQRGTISLGGLLYNDQTITTVDTDKSFVTYLGISSNGSLLEPSLARVFLLDSTTIRAQHNVWYTVMEVSYEVIEFI